jgi:site-specific DNA-methyltransferase (adenine-specific)
MTYSIYNADCKEASKYLEPESVDLMICDPPFGIGESSFDKHYKRKKNKVLSGYIEAPKEYDKFSYEWIGEAKKALKWTGSFYIISGWSNLNDILNAIKAHELYVQNHIIWKYNFGVYTKTKFVTSHYHILYILKSENVAPTFNQYCRFGPQERDKVDNGSLNYRDMEDVWVINKDFKQEDINVNKLPDELINKIILYSSNKGDVVCDFFQGNFTSALCAGNLGRIPTGFELNKIAYNSGMEKLSKLEFGAGLKTIKNVTIEKPINQGKPISEEERLEITKDYIDMMTSKKYTKKVVLESLGRKYGRGWFSMVNITEGIKIKNDDQLELLL